jgi:hypothetical protein
MIAFEVCVNGRRVCLATADLVLSAIVNCTHHRPDAIGFHVGGIRAQDSGDHCDWDVPEIGIGDEVTIRVVDAESPEPAPRVRKPGEPTNT